MLVPRPYQVDAIDAGVKFFHGEDHAPSFQILPTGSGKSLVIANTLKELEGNSLVLQPQKEILEQNYAKYCDYGFRAGIFSDSVGSKRVERVTFATIGSIIGKLHLFRDVRNIIIDECHGVNPMEGMYRDLLATLSQAKVLGLTATPYRLTNGRGGSQLCFLNRTTPRIFQNCLYYIQNNVLFDAGHLAKLRYMTFDEVDRTALKTIGNGSDFSEASMRAYSRENNLSAKIIARAKWLLNNRRNLLTFACAIPEAETIARNVPGSVVISAETSDEDRSTWLRQFKSGKIKHVVNVGVLTTGFDYPELETVLIGRSTMSLALYYQIVGRGMRPHKLKEDCWVVDMGGNVNFFGKIETMKIVERHGMLSIWNNGQQLTDVEFSKN